MDEEQKVEETEVPAPTLIDSPEKWTESSTLSKVVTISTLGGPAEIEIRCFSSEQHQKVIETIEVPEAPIVQNFRGIPSENKDDHAYKLAEAESTFKRMVMTVDMCALEIPGDSLDAKTQWAAENLWHENELKQVYDNVIIFAGFQRPTINVPKGMPVILKDAKSWADAARRPQEITLTHGTGEISFIVRPVSRQVYQQIELACPQPEPPMVPSGALIHKKFVKDEKHPKYLAAVQAVNDKRKVLIFEASLEWKIPGETFEQKIGWILKRPAGEVSALYGHIVGAVNNFQARSSF